MREWDQSRVDGDVKETGCDASDAYWLEGCNGSTLADGDSGGWGHCGTDTSCTPLVPCWGSMLSSAWSQLYEDRDMCVILGFKTSLWNQEVGVFPGNCKLNWTLTVYAIRLLNDSTLNW